MAPSPAECRLEQRQSLQVLQRLLPGHWAGRRFPVQDQLKPNSPVTGGRNPLESEILSVSPASLLHRNQGSVAKQFYFLNIKQDYHTKTAVLLS